MSTELLNKPSTSFIGKLTLPKKTLTKVLSNLIGIIERRPLIPILSHIKIQINLDKIEFSATDMEITIIESVNITNNFIYCFTVSAHLLYDIARKWTEETELEINVEVNKITISNKYSIFTLSTLEGEQFPSVSTDTSQVCLLLKKEDFIDLLESTKHTISTENSRFNLIGLYLHSTAEDYIVYGVSTDGHRLALSSCPSDIKANFGILVPRKTVLEILRLFTKLGTENLKVTLYGENNVSKIRVEALNITITSKLIAANFPDYRKVIPSKFNFSILLHKENFVAAVQRVSCVLNEKNYVIKMQSLQNKIKLIAVGNEGSTAQEVVSITEGDIPNIEISFNYIYLLEACNVIKASEFKLFIIDSKAPALLEAEPKSKLINIVMPMVN